METPFEMEVLPPKHIQPTALESIQRAEVDIQINTAKRYPMHDAAHLSLVKKEMMSFATLDEETAASCFFTLPRGGKSIQGPSVRLAEIALSCYGNLRAATRIIETVATGDQPHVIVQAVCHDLERNVAVCIEKRRRITKKKNKPEPDEDDINLASNAGSAIAIRDAVFKIIPGALIKPVFEAAKRVAVGDAATLADRRARAVDKVLKMGVTLERILGALEKASVEDIDLSALETLFGLFTAVKDGQTNIDEAFPPLPTEMKKPNFNKTKSEKGEEVKAESQQPPRSTAVQGLQNLIKSSRLEDKDVLAFVFSNTGEVYDSIEAMGEQLCKTISDKWVDNLVEIRKQKEGE